MLTPIEIKGTTFKSGMGYAKKPVDDFVEELYRNYETLYKENVELKDKLNTLSEGIQYYKTIEKTLQKALVLAEKTATETKEAAVLQGETIEMEARAKAKLMLADAKNELNRLHTQTIDLARQYSTYKSQFKKIVTTQLEMLESESFQIDFKSLDAFSDMEKYAESNKKDVTEEVYQNDISDSRKEAGSNQDNYNFEQEKEHTEVDSNKNHKKIEEENKNLNLKKSVRTEKNSSSKKKIEKPKQEFQFSVYEESEREVSNSNTTNINDGYDLEPSKEVAASLEELLKNMGVSEEKGKKEDRKKNITSSNEKNKSKSSKRKEIDTMSDQEFLSKILSSSSDSDFMKNVMKSNTQLKKDDDDEAFEFIENE